jgi:hypothetical protein
MPLFGGRRYVFFPEEFEKQKPKPAPPTTEEHSNSYPEQKNYRVNINFKNPFGKKFNGSF